MFRPKPVSGSEQEKGEEASSSVGVSSCPLPDAEPVLPPPLPPEPELSEAERILGPNVRSPVGIPKAYRPSEVSTHDLLRVEIEEFAGPLDLLLFLIRKHDVDILDIPISFITERYLEMVGALEALPLDVAAEFLVMAAELAHIKSKMLLPPKEGVPVEDDPEDEDGDPRADLVRRLLEYQKYREAADELQDRDRLGRDVFARAPGSIKADESFDAGFKSVSIFRLIETMADVLSRLEPESIHQITRDTVTISDRVSYTLDFGRRFGKRFTFGQLLANVTTRQFVVMTFLALLEMARTGVIRIEQEPEVVRDAAEFRGDEPVEGLEPPAPGEIVLVLTGKEPPPDLFKAEELQPAVIVEPEA